MGADKIILIILAAFAVVGGVDRIFGSRLGLGKEFEKAISLMGPLFLTMSGMLILAPLLAKLMSPVVIPVYGFLGADPAIFAGSFLACDMGGYSLAAALSSDTDAVRLGGIIVSSMLGVTVTFTIPVAMGIVEKHDRAAVSKGLLCGTVTIPVGVFAGGMAAGLSPLYVMKNMVPIILLSLLIAVGLWKFERILVRCFSIFGTFMTALSTAGLILAIVQRASGRVIISDLAPLEDVFIIIGEIAIVLAGAFPLMFLVKKLLNKPLLRLSKILKINEVSVSSLVTSFVNSIPVFESVKDMDENGKIINMAFAVSGAFVFGDHLAFCAGADSRGIVALIVAKLSAGICAVLVAMLFIKIQNKKQ